MVCFCVSCYRIVGWMGSQGYNRMNDNYPTDEWIKDIFLDWFDPCELSKGELREFDGLGSSWKHRTFVNPPYSNPIKWVQQAIEENKKGKMIAMLLKHDSSTKWYRLLHEAGAKFLLVNSRLKHKTGNPAPFPSVIAILAR